MQIENALRCTDSSRVVKIITAANPGPKVSTSGPEKHRIDNGIVFLKDPKLMTLGLGLNLSQFRLIPIELDG